MRLSDGETKFLPNSVKYDIEVNNFPWTKDGSRVALVTRSESLASVLIVRITSGTTPSFAKCSNECVFDGNLITFQDTYGHPLGVFSWDPKIKGVASSSVAHSQLMDLKWRLLLLML